MRSGVIIRHRPDLPLLRCVRAAGDPANYAWPRNCPIIIITSAPISSKVVDTSIFWHDVSPIESISGSRSIKKGQMSNIIPYSATFLSMVLEWPPIH